MIHCNGFSSITWIMPTKACAILPFLKEKGWVLLVKDQQTDKKQMNKPKHNFLVRCKLKRGICLFILWSQLSPWHPRQCHLTSNQRIVFLSGILNLNVSSTWENTWLYCKERNAGSEVNLSVWCTPLFSKEYSSLLEYHSLIKWQ